MNLFVPLFITGLFTSFHCIMMCGNLVLSYAVKGSEEGPLARRMMPHFTYHGAKILSYTLVGLLLGSIGSFISQGARSWVAFLAGAYMVLLGLNMTGRFPALRVLTPRPPRFLMTLISKARKKADSDAAQGESSLTTPAMFGLMTGLMPCGPLQAAQVAAAGAGSTFAGGMAMLGFGLGTMPLMLGYGAAASYLSTRFKKHMAVAAAFIVMGLGLVMMNRGAMALGLPVNFNTVKTAVVGSPRVAVDDAKFKTGADGVVEVPLVIENTRYVPSSLAIPADKPVRLVVDRREDNACSDQLAIPQLGILVPLKANGVTSVDIPATKAGSYQMTCQMGMMSGTLQVGGGVAKSSGSPLRTFALVLAVAGAATWALRRWKARLGSPAPAPAAASASAAAKRRGKGGSSPARKTRSPQPQSDGSLVFGFTAVQLILALAGIAAAIMAGLAVGGYFN